MVTTPKEANFYTQEMISFFQGMKKHDRNVYPEVRKAVSNAAAEGRSLGYGEARSTGLVLMAATVATLGKHMNSAPDLVQACMARVLVSEVDWEQVAERFLVNEENN